MLSEVFVICIFLLNILVNSSMVGNFSVLLVILSLVNKVEDLKIIFVLNVVVIISLIFLSISNFKVLVVIFILILKLNFEVRVIFLNVIVNVI